MNVGDQHNACCMSTTLCSSPFQRAANYHGTRRSRLELLERLRAAKIRIPPRSQVLQDIEAMLRDDNSTERMIGQLIGRDAALTAEVFKLVNSPYYRRGAKVDSLERAVRILGRKPMSEIARSATLRQQLGGNDPRMETFLGALHR